MGNSLHNKIYLGRSSVLGSRGMRAVLTVGAALGLGLLWIALRGVK